MAHVSINFTAECDVEREREREGERERTLVGKGFGALYQCPRVSTFYITSVHKRVHRPPSTAPPVIAAVRWITVGN